MAACQKASCFQKNSVVWIRRTGLPVEPDGVLDPPVLIQLRTHQRVHLTHKHRDKGGKIRPGEANDQAITRKGASCFRHMVMVNKEYC